MKRGMFQARKLGLVCALVVSLSVPQLRAQDGTEGQLSPQTPQQPPEFEVSDTELDQQRFQEIHAASLNPQLRMPEDVSEAEEDAYDELLHELVDLEHEAQQRMQTVVRDEGLEVMRFNEIVTAIQQDDELYGAVEDLID